MDKDKVRSVLSMQPKYELVENDLYRIADRIRRIDPDYFILFNKKNRCYEVHNTSNTGSTFCFVVPYEKLDTRTLVYCRETRVERDVDKRIENYNKRAEKSAQRARESSVHDNAKELAEITSHAMNQSTLSYGYSKTHYVRKGAV